MICVKNCKCLTEDEIDGINKLINEIYSYNDLMKNDMIVYEKDDYGNIIAFVGMKTKLYNDVCIISQLCPQDGNKTILNTVEKLTSKLLVACVSYDHKIVKYLEDYGFMIDEVNYFDVETDKNEIIMLLEK